jgi:hypothetical protein
MSPSYPYRYLFVALLFLLTLIAGAFDPSLSRASSESVRGLDKARMEEGGVRYPSSAPRLVPRRLPDTVRDLDPAKVVDRGVVSETLRLPVVVPSVTVQRGPQMFSNAWF